MTLPFRYCFPLLLLSCGGGGGENFDVNGVWVGQLFQASGVICADGQIAGAGFGVPTSQLSVAIRSEGEEGSALEVEDAACVYRGEFSSSQRIVLAGEGTDCRRRMELRFLNSQMLELFFPPDTPTPGTCTIGEEGILEKSEL